MHMSLAAAFNSPTIALATNYNGKQISSPEIFVRQTGKNIEKGNGGIVLI